jgi:hypothetical protein
MAEPTVSQLRGDRPDVGAGPPPRRIQPRIPPRVVREIVLVAGAIVAYFGVRNLTAGGVDAAFANAEGLVRLERALGLDWESRLQDAIGWSDSVVTLANWVYIWGHWPVILATAAALLAFRRNGYYVFRNALFISGAIGFVFFALFPVAPPRLLDLGLVDTVTEQSHAYRALQPPGLTNQYAAFPSLHAGWNLLVGIVLFRTSANLALRAFGVVSPLAMAVAVVATANHYVVDVAAGYVVVLVGLAGALLIERRQPVRRNPHAVTERGRMLRAGEQRTKEHGRAPMAWSRKEER